ncbi:alkaline phosphatase D family protein [Actinokineospora globicatena]|uniref:alkaline phosphatase D family protein n=1 Tax=Actinokineospora globicatena TaxID=103729 RepID=UPI0020A463D6|nr:alkaline phosphatase D family protein [Actinokineospora globicatena]MCP2301905.1 alkaline phosphatase D [Actinokineospora globicatena]GLW76436.1 alkaline phosphatase [Actinokineospora globicatena]GLW83271.1 alkaline phosphatase [Actinokineospora globicatena]
MNTTRRSVLLGGAAAVGLAAVGTGALGSPALATPNRRLTDPFTLGVASGDPTADGVVLWTRLAQDPLALDGLGAMPGRTLPVLWQVATDERFRHVVRTGVEWARPESAHSVHVELAGLRPGTEYFYRFRVQDHVSEVGRTRTAPAPHSLSGALTMCFASCSHYGEGFFTAYRRLAEDHPDLVLHLGDYQYEYAGKAADVRPVVGPETRTLADYRLRHAQYKSDPDLQLAHQVAPWLVVWDDHEVENNWADDVPEAPDPEFPARRAAAFQAYYENMPLRRTARPHGTDMQLFRRVRWGALANFHMLDTRQYRTDQACGDGTKVDCADRLDAARTITGVEQERWLLDGLRGSRARWDVLGQQVFFAQRDLTAGEKQGFSMDAWDGYKTSRDKVAAGLGTTRNGVVLTGDVHRHWAGDVKESFDRPDSRNVGVELVATSITSTGDGADDTNATVLAENPHLKFYKNRRGYVRTRFTARELRADFRVLPYVRTAGAEAATAASFVVEDRGNTLNQV